MLFLKSTSPRRNQILKELGLCFQIEKPDFAEDSLSNEDPLAYLERVTKGKLLSGVFNSSHSYISADTIVVYNNEILQKPISTEDAFNMLKKLNNKWHLVYSSVGFYYDNKVFFDYDQTGIKFKNWTDSEIQKYIQKANPLDKAGSYGIQDKGSPVAEYEGSYINVVGFPLRKFFKYYPYWMDYLY